MDHNVFMRRVIELSRNGMLGGFGGPFGSVIVKDGKIVGEGHNEVIATNDPTAHAEIVAIRRASARLKTFDLSGCEIYINGTPCCMCMASMLWARLDRAYFILEEKDSEAIGLGDKHLYEEVSRPRQERRILPMIHLPELRNEAFAIYELWLNKPDKIVFGTAT
jgi:tRNA(Arg) A34 adenosine deaminase TadA